MESTSTGTTWQQTACILCSVNCGIEVQTRGPAHRARPRRPGPSRARRATPARRRCGSTTTRTASDRLTTPLRRRADGTLRGRSTGTPRSARSPRGSARDPRRARRRDDLLLRRRRAGEPPRRRVQRARRARALGSIYTSNALAQEKTGEFWVDGQLFGRPRCHTTGDFEHAEVAVFVGKNPWQSHGFPRARAILREIAGDPGRALIVIDPRRTETAELADYPPPGPPGHRRVLPERAARRARRGGSRRPRLPRASARSNGERAARRAARRRRSPTTARAPASPRTQRARGRAPHRAGRERLDLRGPRHPAGAAQHAQLLPREAALPAHRQLREAAAAMNIHTRMAGLGGGRRAADARARSAATASSPA